MSAVTIPEFGPNDGFVQEKYEEFLADPQSVDLIWRDFFAHAGSGVLTSSAADALIDSAPARDLTGQSELATQDPGPSNTATNPQHAAPPPSRSRAAVPPATHEGATEALAAPAG